MERYYVINCYSGELYNWEGFDNEADAEEVCNRLNRESDSEY